MQAQAPAKPPSRSLIRSVLSRLKGKKSTPSNQSVSFFNGASNFSVTGSNFVVDQRRITSIVQAAPVMDREHNVELVEITRLTLEDEFVACRGSRLYTARIEGRAVIIRVYESHDANEARDRDVKLNTGLFHPNYIKIIGASVPKSPDVFVIYQGDLHSTASHKVASFLHEDLKTTLRESYQLVQDIVLALMYFRDRYDLFNKHDLCPADFDLLVDARGRVKLAITTVAATWRHRKWFSRKALVHKTVDEDCPQGREIPLLDFLCEPVIKRREWIFWHHVNWVDSRSIYYGKPPRSATLPRAGLRRYIGWPTTLRHGTLELILESTIIEICMLSRATHIPFIREDARVDNYWPTHCCAGYHREEIQLSNVSLGRAGVTDILSDLAPLAGTRCGICNQIVPSQEELWPARPKAPARDPRRGYCENYYVARPPHGWNEDLAQQYPFGKVSDTVEEEKWEEYLACTQEDKAGMTADRLARRRRIMRSTNIEPEWDIAT
uniref:Protein kinase domain-containing protein n=1 Tax=Mycena chlorophos TaxID=658473 RepID=A0ABQ0MD33_MYCCL|nr:predicted protein [Mycena chlorophos]